MSEMGSYFDKLSVETLKNGTCLILRNNKDILVPKNEREEMLNLANFSIQGSSTCISDLTAIF